MAPPRKAAEHRRSDGKPARTFLLALLALLSVLALTAEERTFGTISDEQQMLYTAVSMAEFGEIGIARGFPFTVHRPEGDAVAPYGMALPLLEALPCLLAGPFERAFGAGSSQTLFVGLQLLLVLASAAGAGLLAAALGAGTRGRLLALFGASLGSPLWAYQAAGYSEPSQAAALVLAVLFAALAIRRTGGGPAPRAALLLAAGAGFFAGFAVLGKALNLVLAPFLLAPLLFDGWVKDRLAVRVRLLVAAALGALPPLVAWLAFEVARYGRPFASYGGQNFTHPLLDGLWRLLVGPNEGLLLYFPLLALAAFSVAMLARRKETRGTALGIAGAFLVLLLFTSAWWAWDGTVGWGPRFLVPAVPLLAAAAGKAADGSKGLWRGAVALAALGVAINSLGIATVECAASTYVSSTPQIPLSETEAARYPDYFVERDAQGHPFLPRHFVSASDPALSPFRMHEFLLSARLGASGPEEIERRLASPPWKEARPDLVAALDAPAFRASAVLWYLKTPFAWPHLFSALSKPRDFRASAFNPAWDNALADQVLRAIDAGRPERALALAERLYELTSSGYSAALYAEALRAAGRRETLVAFLGALPPAYRSSPSLGVVQALFARDIGDQARAREILASVGRVLPRPGIQKALESPVPAWPANLHGMTGENLTDRKLELPKLGGK